MPLFSCTLLRQMGDNFMMLDDCWTVGWFDGWLVCVVSVIFGTVTMCQNSLFVISLLTTKKQRKTKMEF